MKSILIHDEMPIGDILARYPEAAAIMEDFGLHCTSCSVNAFEPVFMGAMSHGMSEETARELLAKLEELAQSQHKAASDEIYVTPRAALKIQEFASSEGKEGFYLRISAHDNEGMEPAYGMDFCEKPEKADKVFEFHGVSLLLDKESEKNMKGADVDFLDTQYGSGFKITNPKFSAKGGGCCGGKGGSSCGCGTNGGGCGGGSCGSGH